MARKPPPFWGSATIHPFRAGTASARPWLQHCHLSQTGAPIPTLFNVLQALRGDPVFNGRFGFDQMMCCATLDGEPITDTHHRYTHEWMQDNGIKRVSLETVREAVDIVCDQNSFHPVRDWLNSLQWDGYPRLAEWLSVYTGAVSDEYHRQVGSCFLKSMVARIYEPGCKVDYMLVLEGPQAALKSSVCRLLGGRWFSDTMPDLGGDHVRVSMHLRGKWVIEVAELSAIARAETYKLKQFISSPVEQYVPKHGRLEVREPRQCVFIGTTNDQQYLRDPTGGRRFWPVECGVIDVERLAADREQLFAEAVAEYQRTKRWWPEADFERVHVAPVQEARFEADAWDEPILGYLLGRSRLTIAQIADEALGLKKDRLGVADQRRIANILRNAGWRQAKGTGGQRYWAAP